MQNRDPRAQTVNNVASATQYAILGIALYNLAQGRILAPIMLAFSALYAQKIAGALAVDNRDLAAYMEQHPSKVTQLTNSIHSSVHSLFQRKIDIHVGGHHIEADLRKGHVAVDEPWHQKAYRKVFG